MSGASDRLARSRLALIEQATRKGRQEESRRERENHTEAPEPGGVIEDAVRDGGRWFDHMKYMAGRWWDQQPARVGIELATPMLSAFASRKPVVFLGIAAALGAVVVVARPWRLLTVGGVVAMLLKSGQLSSLVMSAMSASDVGRDRPPYK